MISLIDSFVLENCPNLDLQNKFKARQIVTILKTISWNGKKAQKTHVNCREIKTMPSATLKSEKVPELVEIVEIESD